MLELNLLGRRVWIRSPSDQFLSEIKCCYEYVDVHDATEDWRASLLVDVSASNGRNTVWRVTTDPPNVLLRVWPWEIRSGYDLCTALNQWVVKSVKSLHIFHAAAVVFRRRTVLLPADTCCGKSTLAAALVQKGFDLLSDEIGAVDTETREVACYPRRIFLRRDVLEALGLTSNVSETAHIGPARIVSPEELNGRHAAGNDPLTIVICPRHCAARAGAELRPVERKYAAMTMLRNSYSLRGHRELDWILSLVKELPCFELEFSDAVTASELVLEEMKSDQIANRSLPSAPFLAIRHSTRLGSPSLETRNVSSAQLISKTQGSDLQVRNAISERLRLRPDIIIRKFEEDYILYDPRDRGAALIDVCAAAVLELADGTRTTEEISRKIATTIGTGEINIQHQVMRVLKELASHGFLESLSTAVA